MKSDATYACIVILFVWVLACTAPGLHTVAKKKQDAADKVEALQQKVDTKKAAGEMTNSEFVDTFLNQVEGN